MTSGAPDPLIDAVYAQQLANRADEIVADDTATAERRATAQRAIDACARIGVELAAQVAALHPILAAAGVAIDGVEPVERRQNHTITMLVDGPEVAEQAVAALVPHGFEPWERWEGAALTSFRRFADQMTTARTDGVTTIVRFRWAPRRDIGLFSKIFTPTSGDWAAAALPRWAWLGYGLVRPMRLVAERVGVRPRHRASLGPFLSTPDELLPLLFDAAGLGPDDMIVDLGCGDGRIVVDAAVTLGCRGRGVEHDADLAVRARRRAVTAGVADRVSIDRGDARTADISGATVVFVFLPVDALVDLVPELLDRMRPGARLIAHEQSPLLRTIRPRPDDSMLLLARSSVTVAHRWNA